MKYFLQSPVQKAHCMQHLYTWHSLCLTLQLREIIIHPTGTTLHHYIGTDNSFSTLHNDVNMVYTY